MVEGKGGEGSRGCGLCTEVDLNLVKKFEGNNFSRNC